MASNRPRCAVCGTDIEPADRGRPRSYCSERCKRAAGLLITRAGRRIEALQAQADEIALELAAEKACPSPYTGIRPTLVAKGRALAGLIKKAEVQLLVLLDDGSAEAEEKGSRHG